MVRQVVEALAHVSVPLAGAAWRAVPDDLVAGNLATPELPIVDGAPGLEAAIAALWAGAPVQRCPVPKERDLPAPAPKALHEEFERRLTWPPEAKEDRIQELRR